MRVLRPFRQGFRSPPDQKRPRAARLLLCTVTLASVGGGATALIGAGVAGAATLSQWSGAGTLNSARADATATTLQNGSVLVVGGEDGTGTAMASAELYNPTASAPWSLTGLLHTPLAGATSTLLGNGQVLVTGGWTGTGSAVTDAEIYDPSTGAFTPTSTSNAPAVFDASAVLLQNGNVLVVGGATGSLSSPVPTNAVELYNPTAKTWTAMPAMAYTRALAEVTVLPNGTVLAAGGFGALAPSTSNVDLSTAEIYDPSNGANGSWSATGGMLSPQRAGLVGVVSGNALVTGGQDATGVTSTAQLYNPSNRSWSAAGAMTTPRLGASGTVLPNGQMFVAGGENAGHTALASSESYDPSHNSWTATASSLATARWEAASALMPGGVFLVAGGLDSSGNVISPSTAESFDAGAPPVFTSAATVTATTGAKFSFAVQTTGNPIPTLSQSGTLPAGLTFTASGSGATIAGTPTGPSGTFPVTLVANNSLGITQQTLTVSVVQPAAPGYLVVEKNGTLYPYGQAVAGSSTVSVNAKNRPVVAIGRSPGTTGYYIVTSLGNVYNENGAPFYGSKASAKLPSPIAAFAPTVDGKGYWLAAADGTVYTFGDAVSYSALSVNAKNRPVVAMRTSLDGKGYYLVTKLGNVYNFGDAAFYGSKAKDKLPAPIVGFGLSGDGKGYDIVSSKGNVWNMGDAAFYGSKANVKLPSAVTAFSTSLDGKGYYLVTAGGNIYNYGNATWYGSPVSKKLVTPISSFVIPD